ncbi:MAG: hypothetical protein FWF87_00515 [Synergistaceae bacterium]|nr:hypothetical protein [Synergistaceae bacterium]
MIFELMSSGAIVKLPEDSCIISGYQPEDVILLLPFNRYLRGKVQNGYENWKLCRIGTDGQEEIFLYEGEARTLSFDGGHQVIISHEDVEKLKNALFALIPPPGIHCQAAAVLKGILEPELVSNDLFISDEANALMQLDKKIEAKAAYWAVRFALARGEHGTVSRIKLWYRIAQNIAFSEPKVLVWFSLTQIPEVEAVAKMNSLGFSEEDINRIAGQQVSPVLLFSKNGYLLFASYGDGLKTPLFRQWAYYPTSVWNELRECNRITRRDLLAVAWGANEARQALKISSRYMKTQE